MLTDAKFSADRKCRFWLLRVWDDTKPIICFVLLNPSKANEADNDPTVVKLIAYAQRWGYGGFVLVNIFSYCATDPRELWRAHKQCVDVVGGEKGFVLSLQEYAAKFGAQRFIAGWGKDKTLRHRLVAGADWDLECWKKNADGSPTHPLYLPIDLEPVPFNYTVDDQMQRVRI